MFTKPLQFHCFNYYYADTKKIYVLQMLSLLESTFGTSEKSNLDV